MSERSLTSSQGSHGSRHSLSSGGLSPRRSPLPSRTLAERFDVHYVGSAPLGPFDARLLNMSGLQKPLYNIYLEYLKTGGGTQKRQREVVFTTMGMRVLREEAGTTKEVFLDFGTLLYWDSITLRSFKSAGKKLYGMFESLRNDYRSMVNTPDTLFPLDKKCPTLTMPAAPLVAFVNRPAPNQRDLDCHALAFISVEQAIAFVTTLAKRTKSYYEDYGTLAVDDVLFTPDDRIKNDFNKWKLTEGGWRLSSGTPSNDKNQITRSQSEFVFEHFPSSSSKSSSNSDVSRRQENSQMNYNANWRKPVRGRAVSDRKSKAKSFSESKMRTVSESQARSSSDPDEMYEYGLPSGSHAGSRSPRFREVSPPVDYNDALYPVVYDDDNSRNPPSPASGEGKKVPFHMKTGVKVLPSIEPLQNRAGEAKPSLNRSQSDIGYVSMRTLPEERPSGSGRYPQGAAFESANIRHSSKMKEKEIDSDLRQTMFLEGADDDQRAITRTDFEHCLGYLP